MFMVNKSSVTAGSGYAFDDLDSARKFAKFQNMRVFMWTGKTNVNPVDGFMDPIYVDVTED